MHLQQKLIHNSLMNMILKNKQQYITESYIHLQGYLHITINSQILLKNI